MKKIIFFLLVLSAAMAISQEKKATAPQIAIKIPLGETVMIDGVNIEFVAVLEDSRCPKDVTCVWAGQAKVKLIISGEGFATKNFEIIVGKKNKTDLGVVNGFTLKALALAPYPTTKNTGKRKYALLVVKESD